MLNKSGERRNQIQFLCIEDLVPKEHLLRKIDAAIDWTFIYDLVEDKYSEDFGRPSINPITLIKIPFIQYLYGIKSMRQTIKEIEVNMAYRWFIGIDITDPVPHFSTFGKNYTRRFKDTDIFEQIFSRILEECFNYGFVETNDVFVDATHIKACANNKKKVHRLAETETLFYEAKLKKEIDEDRKAHEKKPLKEKKGKNNSDDDEPSSGAVTGELKEEKVSTTDPESGWFHKGEHKQVFAYSIETACDKHGWILGYTVNKGNEHDSRTFFGLYEKIKYLGIEKLIADAAYKTPAIAKLLLDDGIKPITPYKRPNTKEGFFKKYEYVYDEYYDCYICPNNELLIYSTTNREGYREYKSNPAKCKSCPYLEQCTLSEKHTKVIKQHIWNNYLEILEDLRHRPENRDLYDKRKETIERLFGTAKENHGFRYTQMKGKARMEMKVGLTYACLNLKKLAKMIDKYGLKTTKNAPIFDFLSIFSMFRLKILKI